MTIKAKRDRNILKIEVPFEKPRQSRSGKTIVVATSHGLVTTEVEYKGRPVVVVLNAFVYPKQ